jgi:hypothetical protein
MIFVKFEVFTAVTMKNAVFWDIKTQFLPHRRHITGLHGSDYEEYRLLGYKNPVRTSQEIHYISATQPSRLMLCKIWGLHGGDYEECRIQLLVTAHVVPSSRILFNLRWERCVPPKHRIVQVPYGPTSQTTHSSVYLFCVLCQRLCAVSAEAAVSTTGSRVLWQECCSVSAVRTCP